MLSAYPACFFQEDTGYSVIFPDLNWLSTCGETIEEAFRMAIDCLAGYLYLNDMEGKETPPPSAVDTIDLAAIAKELEISPAHAFLNMVTVDVEEYAKTHFEKSVKKTLTIPSWLNTLAVERNVNFSQVLQEALKTKLHLKQKA